MSKLMPELAHEIPTEDEHWAYLQQHLHGSAYIYAFTPREELVRCFHPEVLAAMLWFLPFGGRELADRAITAIWSGLRRMNQLPRNHPFWHDTNCRPTYYKLGEFCRLELAESPDDLQALWALAVLPVWHFANDFGQEYWLALARLPGFDVRWPLYAALTTELTANQTAADFAGFVQQADAMESAVPILQRIAAEGYGLCGSWATEVLRLIKAA
jgi:hypothetical protein